MSATPPPVVDAIDADIDAATATPEDASAEQARPAVPAFRFPFKPAELGKPSQPNYPGAGKSNHDKSPGRAPNGTRRSMGKR